MKFRVSVIAFIFSVLVVLPVPAAPADSAWEKYNQAGLTAIDEHKLPDAERELGLALKEAEKSHQEDRHLGNTFNNLGLLRLEQKKFAEASEFFGRAQRIFEKLYGPTNLDVAFIQGNLAASYFYQDKFDQAEDLYKRSLATYEGASATAPLELAAALLKTGDFYCNLMNYEKAELLFKRGLSILEKSDGMSTPSVAIALDKLSQLYVLLGRYNEAESLLDRALSIQSRPSSVDEHYQELQKAKRQPNLTILRPQLGEIYDDEPIFVKVKVENFQLETPAQVFGEPNPKAIGHIHITLDAFPLVATAATQHLFGKMAGDEYLAEGRHTLTIELVHDTHTPLTPPVSRTITFYTRHSTSTGGHE